MTSQTQDPGTQDPGVVEVQELRTFTLAHIAHNCHEPALRGKLVAVMGEVSNAWDITRVIIREIEADGNLGQEWRVAPGLLVFKA